MVLSFIVSTIGAFVALTAASGILKRNRAIDPINLLAAGVALGGIGVWAMHFIGMLAMHIDMGVGYALTETIISLLAAVIGSMITLSWVARHSGSRRHLLQAGAFLGLGVCVMHYLGMYGMRFGGFFEWSGLLVAVSVVIALAAATAARYLAFTLNGVRARLVGAVVMALAVCAMHYTGMAAATIVCTTDTPLRIPSGFGAVAARELPGLVTIFALGMAFVIALDQLLLRAGGGGPPRTRV